MSEDRVPYSTYAVKLDTEVKEELQSLLEGFKVDTGANAGDFIKTLVEVYKTNKIVSKVSSTDADIKELNTLTSRIYSIYSNLIERNNNNNNVLQQEFSEQFAEKDNTINNLKTKIQDMQQEHEELQEIFNNVCSDKKELENENSQAIELNTSYKLNISKLQEELISLQDLKEVNKKLLNENNVAKQLLAVQQEDNIKLKDSIKDKDFNINNLNKTIEDNKNEYISFTDRLKKDHVREAQEITDKLNIEKDKAILELKKIHQEGLEKIQSKHNLEIEKYQIKYKSLLEELEKVRSVRNIKKNTTNQNPR